MPCLILAFTLFILPISVSADNVDATKITFTGSNITENLTVRTGDTVSFEAVADELIKSQKRDYDFIWNYVDRRHGQYLQSEIKSEEKIYAYWKLNYLNLNYSHTFPEEGLYEIKINGYRKNPWDGLQFTAKWIVTVIEPTGEVRVTIDPLEARSNGAQWRLQERPDRWLDSGQTYYNLPVGPYTVEFRDIPEYLTPSNVNLDVQDGNVAVVSSHYKFGNLIDQFNSGVFFSINSDPVKSSVNYDNSKEAWSLQDEINDFGGKNYESLVSDPHVRSHFLYGYKDFYLASDAVGNFDYFEVENSGELFENRLDNRQPLILVHGWQGDVGSNNYIGSNKPENLPEAYWQEFLAFYEAGGQQPNAPEAAKYLHEHYKIYLYHYPSFEHVTYNGRLLGEAVKKTPEIWDHVKSGGQITIVAHSMGGLVARSFIEEHGIGQTDVNSAGDLDAAGNIRGDFIEVRDGLESLERLITLGTPHHGSPSAMIDWVDASVLVKKNILTPGALDLYWDDNDDAIKFLFENGYTEIIELPCTYEVNPWLQYNPIWGLWEYAQNSTFCQPEFDAAKGHYLHEGSPVATWQPRGKSSYDGVDRFDKYYGERFGDYTFQGDKQYYEEPNPWLRNLNELLFNRSPALYSDKYYFYGGSVADSSINDHLSNGWKSSEPARILRANSNYFLNDSVVPTRSAFLEYVDFNIKGSWSNTFYRENLANFIESVELTQPPLFYLEESLLYGKARYFHDFDHDMMRGGTGKIEKGQLNSSTEYGDNWKNNYYTDYWSLIDAIDYPGDFSPLDLSYPEIRLWHEPLFLRISMDLGFSGSNDDVQPYIGLKSANFINDSEATINAVINPNGNPTTITFDYGTSSAYGNSTETINLEAGSSNVSVSSAVTDLACGTQYHYRVRATNNAGMKVSQDASFLTTPCPTNAATLTTSSTRAISESSAILNATVNPNGASTTLYFNYGTSTAYGYSTEAISVGSETTEVTVDSILNNLDCGTTYYFRTRAINAWGTSVSSTNTFDTLSCPDLGEPGTMLLPPEIYPPGGMFHVPPTITIDDPSGKGSIYYSLDEGATWQPYIDPVQLGYDTYYFMAYTAAVSDQESDSEKINYRYTVFNGVPEPLISLSSGTYTEPQDISILNRYLNSDVYYTLDGTEPTPDSQIDTGSPISIPVGNTTFRAIAIAFDGTTSQEVTKQYEIIEDSTDDPSVELSVPVISPSEGVYQESPFITISNPSERGSVYYSLDDGQTWQKYDQPFELGYGEINVLAYTRAELEGDVDSGPAYYQYLVYDGIPQPSVALPPGTHLGSQEVRLINEYPDASIYYTLDGTEPGLDSSIYYGSPFVIEAGFHQLRARAISYDGYTSPVLAADYTIVQDMEATIIDVTNPENTSFDPIWVNVDNQVDIQVSKGSGNFEAIGYPNYYGQELTITRLEDGTFNIKPPEDGAFAGSYGIGIEDLETGQSLYYDVYVPLQVVADRNYLLGGHDSTQIEVKGGGPDLFYEFEVREFDSDILIYDAFTITQAEASQTNTSEGNPAVADIVAEATDQDQAYYLLISASGYEPVETNQLDVVVPAVLSGSITDNEGNPLTDVVVTASELSEDVPYVYETVAEEGTFELLLPASGLTTESSIRIYRQGYDPTAVLAEQCLDQECAIYLKNNPDANTYGDGLVQCNVPYCSVSDSTGYLTITAKDPLFDTGEGLLTTVSRQSNVDFVLSKIIDDLDKDISSGVIADRDSIHIEINQASIGSSVNVRTTENSLLSFFQSMTVDVSYTEIIENGVSNEITVAGLKSMASITPNSTGDARILISTTRDRPQTNLLIWVDHYPERPDQFHVQQLKPDTDDMLSLKRIGGNQGSFDPGYKINVEYDSNGFVQGSIRGFVSGTLILGDQ